MDSSTEEDPMTDEEEENKKPSGTYTDPSKGLSWEKTHFRKGPMTVSSSGNDFQKIQDAYRYPARHFRESLKRVEIEKKPSVSLASAGLTSGHLLDVIDYYDREGNAYATGPHAFSGTYAYALENEPGKRIPKAGAFAGATLGKARAEYSVLDAEANAPNASAAAEASATGITAMARAELASVSVDVGPFNVTLGLGADTGISVGADGVEVKLLGTGFTIGPHPSISFLGSSLSII